MPQELHVLRCFSCETFQVDIIKKIPKWTCKMCGEKQSLKKVYGQGTGKDCRLIVQNLNQQRISLQHEVLDIKNEHVINKNHIKPHVGELQATNKWLEFLVEDVKEEIDDEGSPSFEFDCQRNKRQKVNGRVHQNTATKEVNNKKLLYIPQSECDLELENVAQKHCSEVTVINSNGKWKEFCSQEREDKSREEQNTEVLTTKDFRNTQKRGATNIFADEDIDLDLVLDF